MSAWGISSEEKATAFPCDRYVMDYDAVLYRGVSIQAPAEIVFRWLCQMRTAPYSYDWIDNLGRQSPRVLIPGLDRLEIGQSMMGFELIEFEQNRQLTLRGKSSLFGEGVGTYLVLPRTQRSCRLLVKIFIKYPSGVKGLLMRTMLPWGDLIMMRKQLQNFKTLSERSYRASAVVEFKA